MVNLLVKNSCVRASMIYRLIYIVNFCGLSMAELTKRRKLHLRRVYFRRPSETDSEEFDLSGLNCVEYHHPIKPLIGDDLINLMNIDLRPHETSERVVREILGASRNGERISLNKKLKDAVRDYRIATNKADNGYSDTGRVMSVAFEFIEQATRDERPVYFNLGEFLALNDPHARVISEVTRIKYGPVKR
jgi:hypothetical protein